MTLAADLHLTPTSITQRLAVLGLGPTERAALRALAPRASVAAPAVIAAFYQRLQDSAATRRWISDAALVGRLRGGLARYLDELFTAELDFEHALGRVHIGVVHNRIRLRPDWYIASYGQVICDLLPVLFEGTSSVDDALDLAVTLIKTVLFDASLALDGYAMSATQEAREATLPLERDAPAPVAAAASAPCSPMVARARVADQAASERAAFLGIDAGTLAELRALAPAATAQLPMMLEEFYAHVARWPDTQPLVPAPVVDRLKRSVDAYWRELFSADFQRPYAASRTLVGIVHERVGLSAPAYVIGLAHQLARLLRTAVPCAPSPRAAADALVRAVFFDLSFVLQAYVDARAEAVLRTDGFAAQLLAGLSAGVAILDHRTRIEVVNRALLALFAVDPGVARFAELRTVVPVPEIVTLVDRLRASGERDRVSTVVRWGGRTYRASALRLAATDGTIALVIDELDELVRTHHEALALERDLSTAFDHVGAMTWAADASGTLAMASRSTLQVTGHRDVALLARPGAFLALLPEPDRARLVAAWGALAPGDQTELVHRITRLDGAPAWLRTIVARDATEPGARYRGLSVDVTEAHLANERRMEAIGKLAGGIAHEYNNQLTVILSTMQLLTDEVSGEARAMVDDARDAAMACATLTRQLLAFAQRQPLRPRVVQLNQVIDGARASLGRFLAANVHLELQLDPHLWSCNVDVAELELALASLIANANESMPQGGRLTLSTRNVPATATADPRLRAAEDLVEVAIRDTGVGMDVPVRERAFEPFFTTKDMGTGLGLASVHGFVAQSGGRVTLDTQRGAGTVVRLMFPRVAPVNDPAAASGRPLVLAVDDEAPLRRILARLLAHLGYEVVIASSTETALEILRRTRPDVLLTDVVLANEDSGVALAARARALIPGLPVVYISGYTREQLDLHALADREWFVTKPFEREVLARALADAVRAAPWAARRGA